MNNEFKNKDFHPALLQILNSAIHSIELVSLNSSVSFLEYVKNLSPDKVNTYYVCFRTFNSKEEDEKEKLVSFHAANLKASFHTYPHFKDLLDTLYFSLNLLYENVPYEVNGITKRINVSFNTVEAIDTKLNSLSLKKKEKDFLKNIQKKENRYEISIRSASISGDFVSLEFCGSKYSHIEWYDLMFDLYLQKDSVPIFGEDLAIHVLFLEKLFELTFYILLKIDEKRLKENTIFNLMLYRFFAAKAKMQEQKNSKL